MRGSHDLQKEMLGLSVYTVSICHVSDARGERAQMESMCSSFSLLNSTESLWET